eukprot:2599925-Rhodomonas_salina.1
MSGTALAYGSTELAYDTTHSVQTCVQYYALVDLAYGTTHSVHTQYRQSYSTMHSVLRWYGHRTCWRTQ